MSSPRWAVIFHRLLCSTTWGETATHLFTCSKYRQAVSSAAWLWLGNLLVCQWNVLSNFAHRLSHGYNSLKKGSQAEQALPVVNIPCCTRGRYTSYFRELSCDCSCSLQFLHPVWTVLQKPINISDFFVKILFGILLNTRFLTFASDRVCRLALLLSPLFAFYLLFRNLAYRIIYIIQNCHSLSDLTMMIPNHGA